MSLPIVRLRVVDANCATAADNPVTASCTLYTFLRSVPSNVECDMAMVDFKQSVQATRGHSYLSKGNERLLNLIHASVQDSILRHPPKVSPQLARNATTWRMLLQQQRQKQQQQQQQYDEDTKTSNSTATATRSQDFTHTDYENDDESTQAPVLSSLASSTVGEINSNSNTKSKNHELIVKETITAASMRVSGPYEQAVSANWRHAPGASNTTTAPRPFTEENDDNENQGVGVVSMEAAPPVYSPRAGGVLGDARGGCRPHPLLLALLERARATLPVEEHESDRREREFATMMESRAAALRTKLSSAYSMMSPQEREHVEFLRQLEKRVAIAEKLFEVQKYEEKTIQMSQCALQIEVATMRALLHQVVDAVVETEERHEREGPQSPYYAEECQLMALIQQSLDEVPS
ncbi:hypothetical protein DQ04_00031330 [Trypanosoma grayi]|uniref:hypothetical protein n=1 Tax=Trypanosoma grayi TaxID=71804 RepID=UPI0004F4A163|nr:hypothetical protein DQ04_00031330 [Trypanosoma grayi]KEG15599.1 hypothetical protein DQ04_00031330 [Trypanosoma grayi]